MMSTPGMSSGILRLKRSQMKGKSSGKKRNRTLYNKLNISLNSTKIVREALNLNNRALSTEQLKIQNEIHIMKTKCRLLMEENDNLDSEIEMLDRVASLTNSEEKCQAVIDVKEKVHVTGLTNLVLETMKDVNNALKSYKFLRFILNDAEKVMDIPTDNINSDDVNIEDSLSYTDRLETVLNNMIKSADEEIKDNTNVCADTSVDEEMKASNRFNHNPCDVGLPQRIPCDSKDTPEESTENSSLQVDSDTFQNGDLVLSEMEEDYELSKTEDVLPVANSQEAGIIAEDKTIKQPLSPQRGSRIKLQKPCEDEEIVVDETIYLNTDMEMTEVIEFPINLGNKNNSSSTFKKPESKASTEDFLVSLRPKQNEKFGPENLFGFEFQTPDNKVKSSFKHPETKVISKQDKYDRLVVESEEDILKGDNSEGKTLSRSKSRCRSKSKKTDDSVNVEPSLFSDEPCEIFNIPLQRESPLSKPKSKTGRSKHKKKTITMIGNDELEVGEASKPCITKDHVIDIMVGESKEDKNKSPVENISKGNSRSKTRCRSDDVRKADTTTVTTAVPSPTTSSLNVDISKDNTLSKRGNTRNKKKSHRSEDENKPDTAMIVPNTPTIVPKTSVNNVHTHLPDDKLSPKPILHEEKSRRKFHFSDGNSEDVLDEVKQLSIKSKSKKSSNLQRESQKLVSDSSSNEESPILRKRTSLRYSNEGIKDSVIEIMPTRKMSTNEDDEIFCIPDSCKKSKKSFDSPARNEEDVDQDDSDNKFKRSRRTKEPISYKERPINIKMRKEITDGKIVESCRLSEKGYSNAKIPLDNVTNVQR